MIFVDPRYGSAPPGRTSAQKTVALALADLGVEVVESPMAFGDFAFVGQGPEDTALTIGIEMKTVQDFVTSMQNGRLAEHQVPGLLTTYDRSYVVIEGFYRARRGSGLLEVPAGGGWRPLNFGRRPVLWGDVERFITSLEEAGIRVRRTRTSQETARVLGGVLYPFWQKPYSEHRTLHAGYSATAPMQLVAEDEARTRIRRVCVALKSGIGWGRSKVVADRFGSVYELVTADPQVWEGLAGVGKGIVAQTQDALHERAEAQAAPAGSVPAGRDPVARSAGHTRARAHRQLDAGHRAERGVHPARGRRRASRRGKSQ